MTPNDQLETLITEAGGVAKFCKTFRYRVGVTPPTVYAWLNGQHPINPNAIQAIKGKYNARKPTTEGET